MPAEMRMNFPPGRVLRPCLLWTSEFQPLLSFPPGSPARSVVHLPMRER